MAHSSPQDAVAKLQYTDATSPLSVCQRDRKREADRKYEEETCRGV